MLFTPSQVIVLADINAETLRYWKRFVPSLASKRGHTPCYTRAEIVGLIVIRRLVRDFKMDVSVLQPKSESLFSLCAAQWAAPSRRLLRITCAGSVTAHEVLSETDFGEPTIVFPLDTAIEELEQRLNERESDPQLELGLIPLPIKTRSRSAL